MSKYDNSFTDELRQRLSLVDVISRRVPLTKKGQNYWGCCPFHNEKTPSFSVNEDKGFYHCFGCGEHGDIISFIMKSENLDFVNALKELANMAGIKMPENGIARSLRRLRSRRQGSYLSHVRLWSVPVSPAICRLDMTSFPSRCWS